MKAKRYSELEKEQLIKEVKDCGSIPMVCKKHQIPASTVHSWLKRKTRKKSPDSPESIQKLRKKLSDQELKIRILEDLLKKTNQAWLGE